MKYLPTYTQFLSQAVKVRQWNRYTGRTEEHILYKGAPVAIADGQEWTLPASYRAAWEAIRQPAPPLWTVNLYRTENGRRIKGAARYSITAIANDAQQAEIKARSYFSARAEFTADVKPYRLTRPPEQVI